MYVSLGVLAGLLLIGILCDILFRKKRRIKQNTVLGEDKHFIVTLKYDFNPVNDFWQLGMSKGLTNASFTNRLTLTLVWLKKFIRSTKKFSKLLYLKGQNSTLSLQFYALSFPIDVLSFFFLGLLRLQLRQLNKCFYSNES